MQVDVELTKERVAFEVHECRGTARCVGGVVDQDVYPAEAFDRLADEVLQIFHRCHVDSHRERLTAVLFYGGDSLADRARQPGMGIDGAGRDDDIGAPAAQLDGCVLADPSACSGDDDRLAVNVHDQLRSRALGI